MTWRNHDGAARWRVLPAFTMIELLVVICIISLLLGFIIPSFMTVREQARRAKDKITVKHLETAFKAYLDQYKVWPPGLPDDVDHELSGDVYLMLSGVLNNANFPNPEMKAFFDFPPPPPGAPVPNTAYDAWSTAWAGADAYRAYRFRIDHDYDNKIGTEGLYHSVMVWSVGADRESGTGDDIRSWE